MATKFEYSTIYKEQIKQEIKELKKEKLRVKITGLDLCRTLYVRMYSIKYKNPILFNFKSIPELLKHKEILKRNDTYEILLDYYNAVYLPCIKIDSIIKKLSKYIENEHLTFETILLCESGEIFNYRKY